MTPTRKPLLPLAAIAAVALTLLGAGCGEKQENGKASVQTFNLALDYFINPDHAGIFEALDQGYFRQAGLDVKAQPPSDPAAPIKEVAAGRADLAISYEPEVLIARDQGLDVVAVASLVPRPLTSLISLGDAGINTVADLKGKKVATAGIPYQTKYLQTILRRAGLTPGDVQEVNAGEQLVPFVLGGKVAAILGGYPNVEGVDLRLLGKNPRVVPVGQLGVPDYDELVLVANDSKLAKDPQAVRVFLAALRRGTQAATKDPAQALKALLAAGHGLDPKKTRAELTATLPLLQPEPGKPFGYMSPDRWRQYAGWMVDNGLISKRPVIADALSNDYLPSRGP